MKLKLKHPNDNWRKRGARLRYQKETPEQKMERLANLRRGRAATAEERKELELAKQTIRFLQQLDGTDQRVNNNCGANLKHYKAALQEQRDALTLSKK